MKAFVINVVGDVGMVLAALFILRELGTLDLEGIFAAAEEASRSTRAWRSRSAAC